MNNNFYKYTASDFDLVPFDQIKPGDFISWINMHNLKSYGAVKIVEIDKVLSEYVVWVSLPEGAEVTSNEDRKVFVRWEGGRWRISVCVHYSGESLSPRMILRR